MRQFVLTALVPGALVLGATTVPSGAQCTLAPGAYSYLNGRGQATLESDANGDLRIELRWEDGDVYHLRVAQKGDALFGDWALIRENGQPVAPVFRRYEARVNPDCSFVGTTSEDPAGRAINGTVIHPK